MKKILIVDDESFKSEQIISFLSRTINDIEFDTATALNEGLYKAIKNTYDLILLDMSLPLFDKDETSNFNSYGGMDFLREMKRKNDKKPVLIITQYELLGEGSYQRTSQSINEECMKSFENYNGMIIYSSIDNNWEEELYKKVRKITDDKGIDC